MQKADIACPYPAGKPVLVNLCGLAAMAEEAAGLIYSRKSESLWDLYTRVESLHTRLQQYAQHLGIGSAAIPQRGSPSEAMAKLTLHNSESGKLLQTFIFCELY